MIALGRRMAAAREAAGLSQGYIAARLGVTQPTVSRWESGDRTISIGHLTAYAALCQASLYEIMEGRIARPKVPPN